MIGQILGHYRVVAKIGEGGMGVVYCAYDEVLRRDVALKVVKKDAHLDSSVSERILHEARASSSLAHPNICTIHEVGETDGELYIVMELVQGKSLLAMIPDGGLVPESVLRYGVQIASALVRAHDHGIVHQDLKTANIVVTPDGLVKVLDFGLAKQVSSGTFEDRTRSFATIDDDPSGVRGTLPYMAPEILRGDATDGRSDLWALGVVLYEAASGRLPFEGRTGFEISSAIMREIPKPLGHPVPPGLWAVIRHCLIKEPIQRYQRAGEVQAALEAVQSGAIVSAPGADPGPPRATVLHSARKVEDEQVASLPHVASTEPPRRPAKLPFLKWWVTLAVAACILIGLVYLRLKTRLEEASRLSGIQRLTVVPLTSLPGNVVSPAFSPDGSEVVFGWDGGTEGAGYDVYVKVIGSENPLRITRHPSEKLSIAWSPDGRVIAISRVSKEGASGIFLVPPTGGPERKIYSRSSTYWYGNELSWSPDGKYLAFTDHPETSFQSIILYLLSMSTLKAVPVKTECKDAALPSFSPKGELLAWVCSDTASSQSLRLLHLKDGGVTELLQGNEGIGGIGWSRDGDNILYSSPISRGGLWELALAHPERAQKLTIGHDVSDVTVSPSGHRLVYVQGSTNTNIWQLDLQGPRAQAHKLIVSSAEQESPSISPDGRKIAFESNRNGNLEIWVCDGDGSNALQLTSFGVVTGTPRWSPDGGLIAFDSRFGGKSNLYTVDPAGGVPARLNIDVSDNSMPSWSPDGKWIYFMQGDDTAEPSVWKVPSRGGHAVQLASTPAATPLASPDGQYVYFFRKKKLWRMMPDGSSPEEVKGMPELSFQGIEWFPSKAGIYFMSHKSGKTTIELYDTGTQKISPIFTLEKSPPYWIGAMPVSPDGTWMLFPQVDGHSSNLMMVENIQ